MSTTADEMNIDLDEIDKKKTEEADKKADVKVEVVTPEAKTEEKPILEPEAGLEKLKKQLEDEKAARQDAERRARASAEAEVQARTEAQDNRLHVVTNAISTIKQSQKNLRTEYATAMASQDYEKVAELNEQISDNSAKLLQLEQGKIALEKAPKPTKRDSSDPVEQFTAPLSPRSAAWVRAHPEFVTNEKKNRQMIAAHEYAIESGAAPDSDEYFRTVERRLEIGSPDTSQNGHKTSTEVEVDPMKDAAKPAPKARTAPASAPVSRSGNGAGERPNTVRLTAAEVEAAADSGLTPEEYARNKLALKKENRLN